MENHFNNLTPAEAERLAMLAEEAGEIVQSVGKILRHGYESHHPSDHPSFTNRLDLKSETIDVLAVLELMNDAGDLPNHGFAEIKNAMVKKREYAHHQIV